MLQWEWQNGNCKNQDGVVIILREAITFITTDFAVSSSVWILWGYFSCDRPIVSLVCEHLISHSLSRPWSWFGWHWRWRRHSMSSGHFTACFWPCTNWISADASLSISSMPNPGVLSLVCYCRRFYKKPTPRRRPRPIIVRLECGSGISTSNWVNINQLL